jgi:hypothetical protein
MISRSEHRSGFDDHSREEHVMEKRTMKRFNLSLRTILSFADAPSRDMQTKDISVGGAFFETYEPVPEGTKVFLSIFPLHHDDGRPDMQIVEKISGEVRRRSNNGMAIRFDQQHHF